MRRTLDSNRPAIKMECRRYTNKVFALGQAVNLLRDVSPFSGYQFDRIANVLIGQIRRNHYVFTIAGGRAVGYAGWALCEESVARAWIEQRYVPSFEECLNGDCLVGITFYARTPEVCRFQARWCRNLYPDTQIFGIRDYGAHERPKQLGNPVLGRRSASDRGSLSEAPRRRSTGVS